MPRRSKAPKAAPPAPPQPAQAEQPPAEAPDPQPSALELKGASETMQLIRRAVRSRWRIPERVYEAAPAIVARILLDPATDTREKIRAVQTLAMLDRDNIDLVLEANKIERLEAGKSTENVSIVASISDAQIAAVAMSLLPKEQEGA